MVPGDVALLAAGNLAPCDGRVLEAKDFFVNQARLLILLLLAYLLRWRG